LNPQEDQEPLEPMEQVKVIEEKESFLGCDKLNPCENAETSTGEDIGYFIAGFFGIVFFFCICSACFGKGGSGSGSGSSWGSSSGGDGGGSGDGDGGCGGGDGGGCGGGDGGGD